MSRRGLLTQLPRAIGIVSAVAFSIGLAGCHPKPVRPPLLMNATFELTDQGGRCVPSNPQAMHANRGSHLVWTIRNRCSQPYYVRLDRFTPPGGNPTTILRPGAPETNAAIQPNGSVGLPADVLRTAAYGKYKYEIQLKGSGTNDRFETRLDPDIDIWP